MSRRWWVVEWGVLGEFVERKGLISSEMVNTKRVGLTLVYLQASSRILIYQTHLTSFNTCWCGEREKSSHWKLSPVVLLGWDISTSFFLVPPLRSSSIVSILLCSLFFEPDRRHCSRSRVFDLGFHLLRSTVYVLRFRLLRVCDFRAGFNRNNGQILWLKKGTTESELSFVAEEGDDGMCI